MDNIFSLKRIGFMVQADWFAYKKRLSLLLGMVFLALLFIVYNAGLKQQYGFFLFSLLMALMAYCNNCLEPKLHKFTEQYLTLPAFNFEKYIEILLIGAIHVIAYSVIYILALFLNHILFGKEVLTVAQLLEYAAGKYGILFFLWNYIFFMYVFFKRHGLQAAIISLAIIIGIIWFIATNLPITVLQSIGEFFKNYYNPVLLIIGIGLLCVAYWKIKVKQIV